MEAEAARQTQLAAQLRETVDARMAENNRLQALQVVTGFANAAANTVTAVNSGRMVNNTASIANSMGQVAGNTNRMAQSASKTADSLAGINAKLRR